MKTTRSEIKVIPARLSHDKSACGLKNFGVSDTRDNSLTQFARENATDINAQATQPAAHTNNQQIPGQLKTGLEHLSGVDLSGVKVHYNSSKPATVGALAYAQGNEIHLGPGQEAHLPHEGWHIVQQRQQRVNPTETVNGVSVNSDASLEREADKMGTLAIQRRAADVKTVAQRHAGNRVIQREPDVMEWADFITKSDGNFKGHPYEEH